MTSRERRTVMIGGILVTVVIVGARAAPPLVDRYLDLRMEVAARGVMLARMRETIHAARVHEDSAAAIRDSFVGLASRLLDADTEAGAFASLTRHLETVASRSLTALERADAVPDSTAAGALRRVTVRATLEGDTRGIATALRAIDVNAAALEIGAVRIVALDPASNEREVLKGEITVSGWYMPGRDE